MTPRRKNLWLGLLPLAAALTACSYVTVAARDEGAGGAGGGGGPTTSCAPTERMCGGSCVDTATDARHCGECDAACDPRARCVAGACEPCGFTLEPTADLVMAHGVHDLVAADLDGDGRLDLAATNEYPSAVSVFLGQGDGSYGARTDHPAGEGAGELVTADLDGDGRLDLVTGNLYANTVSTLANRGDGSFDAPVAAPTLKAPRSLAVGDFDGDGRPDLATLAWTYSSPFALAVLLGKSDGTLKGTSVPEVELPYPSAVAAGDLDGDGKLDLAVTTDDHVRVLLGHGDGTFEGGGSFAAPGLLTSMMLIDVDADGALDVVVADRALDKVGVLLGRGDGTLEPPLDHPLGGPTPQPRALAAGDLDGDGHLDLATANYQSGTVSVLLGRGDGTFLDAPTLDVATPPGPGNPVTLALGDLDGDGRLDLVTGNTAGSLLRVFTNRTCGR